MLFILNNSPHLFREGGSSSMLTFRNILWILLVLTICPASVIFSHLLTKVIFTTRTPRSSLAIYHLASSFAIYLIYLLNNVIPEHLPDDVSRLTFDLLTPPGTPSS